MPLLRGFDCSLKGFVENSMTSLGWDKIQDDNATLSASPLPREKRKECHVTEIKFSTVSMTFRFLQAGQISRISMTYTNPVISCEFN